MKTEKGKIKFSFMEMVTSGHSGCVSATGFLGVVTGLVMLVMFVVLVFYYFVKPENSESVIDIINQATIWFGMASALLGCRKITGMIGNRKGTQTIRIGDDKETEIVAEEE